ncbi:MAG TPA: tetratricopeptide repeat protein, partial [Acidimicrobiales bacterium]|nr:tetratricopeptide repeat protein [Acidimicrobiales bacterium]
ELVKVDVDANPRISATFDVKSIPAVFALRDRRVVDSFIGALPEAQVQAFVDKLAPPATEVDRLLAAGDEASLRQALELDHDHPAAVLALAQVLIEGGEGGEALELLKRLPETADVRRVAAQARLSASASAGDASSDDDLENRFESLLARVKDDETARQQFLDMLEMLGVDDPRKSQYRRALAARLY